MDSRKPKFVLMTLLVAALAVVSDSGAQERTAIEAALETVVQEFTVTDRPAPEVFEGISQSYSIPIIAEEDVTGNVKFRIFGAKLRNVLDAICAPYGWHYEIDPKGDYLVVRKYVTRVYPVDYLQLTQTGSSSASVSLTGGAASGTGQYGNGQYGGGAATMTGGANSAAGLNGMGNGSGSSTIALNATNDVDFWALFEKDVNSFLEEGEKIAINRFAGIVQLTATLRTHSKMETYIARVMKRVRRSAKITVRLVRVDLSDRSSKGVDWAVAASKVGTIAGTAINVGGEMTLINGIKTSGFGTATGPITEVGGQTLPVENFRMVIKAGDVGAVLRAVEEQGNVSVESRPAVSALNNQTALIQVSEDRPLFKRTFSSQTQTSGVTPVTQTNNNYDQTNVSFGNVLEVTPQIDDNLVTSLAISPSLTDFRGTVPSPDGLSTAFVVGVQRFRSTVVLRNGETAILGGFIEETDGTKESGVAGLSKVPVLGNLFKTTARANVRHELAILVTVNAEDIDPSKPVRVASPDADQTEPSKAPAPAPISEQPLKPAMPQTGKVELVGGV